MKSFKDLREKTLTPAEKKKREEIAKAMERENPGMDMKKKMAIATWQAKKVAEAKDPNEYDKEGEMMKNQLRQICSANEKLMKMVGDDDNLPEWVQNKVTKATDYIRSVRDYLDAEDGDDEEDDEDESMEESVTISPLQKIRMDKEKADRNKDDKDKSQAKRMTDKQYAGYKVKMKEEAEELDEISRDLARRYIRKVADKTNTGELSTKQVMKRRPGVNLAGKKAYPGVAGEPRVRATESVELDELNKSTLGSYIKKASTNQIGNTAKVLAGKNDPDTERARKRMGQRMSGIAKATDKLTKEEAELDEKMRKKDGYSSTAKVAAGPARAQKESAELDEAAPGFEVYTDPKSGKAAVRRTSTATAPKPTKAAKTAADDDHEAWREKNAARRQGRVYHEETELDENVGGLFKNASEWESSAKARGLVVKPATHPSGEMTKYQIAKDKQGNNRGHFDHGTKSGRLKEEAEQIDELKKSTLGSYISKADANRQEKDRSKGIDLAVRKKHPSLAAYMKKSAKVNANEEAELDEGLYHVEYGRGGKLTHQVIAKDAKDAHQKAMAHLKKKNPKLAHPDYADTFNKPSITHVKGNEPRADKYKTEAVQSADKKPEKYVRPDGKVGIRMVKTDKKMIKND